MEGNMNKELRELLASINEKKETARKLVAENKLDEARTLKNEIEQMQDKFDLMKDLYEDEKQNFEDNLEKGNAKKMKHDDTNKRNSTKDFANAARRLFKMTNQMSEGVATSGGYTVPDDVQTKIEHLREAKGSLQGLVTTVPVKTNKGSRTYRKRKKQTGFTKVGEGGKMGKNGKHN